MRIEDAPDTARNAGTGSRRRSRLQRLQKRGQTGRRTPEVFDALTTGLLGLGDRFIDKRFKMA